MPTTPAAEQKGAFERIALAGGIDLFVWPTQRFKTGAVRLLVIEPLDGDASARALLAGLLKRGCSRYPDMRSLSRRLEELYGAALGVDVGRLGERHLTQVRLGFVSERALRAGLGRDIPHAPFREGVELMLDVLTDPVVERDAFRTAEFEQERTNLLRAIQGLRDDKSAYAHDRARQEMFAGEPYAIHELGDLAHARALAAPAVLDFHRARLRQAPIEVYAAGDIDSGDVERLRDRIEERFAGRVPLAAPSEIVRGTTEPRTVREEAGVAQSRLWIGYRFDPRGLPDRDYFALGVFDALLGGGSLSKLFQEVREKRSLAYSAHSMMDRLKGALFLAAGVARARCDEAAAVMRAQVGALQRGEFSEVELGAAKNTLLNGLQGIHDSADRAIQFAVTARAVGRSDDVMTFVQGVEGVTREDVVRVAALPQEGVTYKLLGADHDGADAGHESAG